MKAKKSYMTIFTNGFLKENPVLRLVLGTCPALAITTAAFNGIGMGLAATFVLVCSNIVVSALRKLIPSQVRLPCFIVIIASFVTLIHMLIRAFVPALDASLGVFLPLITVNCMILGRAEMFASKNKILPSAIDGLGMGIGFTITLFLMSAVREVIGAGAFFGMALPWAETVQPMSIMILPPGGFFVFGIFMAIAIFIETKMGNKPSKTAACGACPSAEFCPAKGVGEE